MTLKFLVLTGTFLLTPLLAAGADSNLYDMVETMTLKELSLTNSGTTATEWYLRQYTAAVIGSGNLITPDDVQYAIRNQYDALCKQTALKPAQTYGDCLNVLAPSIKRVVENETRVRALGRELTLIAAGYEHPVSDKQETLTNLPLHYRSLIRIWQAGTGATVRTQTGLALRTIAPTNLAAVEQKAKAVGDALTGLIAQKPKAEPSDPDEQNDEAMVAAVWRYLHGIRFVSGERREFPAPPRADAFSGKGTERQYLFLRQTAVENALKDLWSTLESSTINPPLKRGEIAIFTLPESVQSKLPPNILLWGYRERTASGSLSGDIGLDWKVAMEPVLPSLCEYVPIGTTSASCKAVRGGLYPPVTASGTGLCTHPLQRMGYLCRPIDAAKNPSLCDNTKVAGPNEIILTSCKKTSAPRETLAGPDACMDAGWTRSTIPFNPNTQCKVNLSCESSGFTGGLTEPKKADGTINVKVSDNPDGGGTYIAIHELVHARQQCELPPGIELYEGEKKLTTTPPGTLTQKEKEANDPICCMREGEAYRKQCEAMEEDGIFKGSGTGEIMSTLGFPLNVETCWQFLTDTSCKTRTSLTTGRGCPSTFSYDRYDQFDLKNSFIPELNNLVKTKKPENVGYTCQESLNPPAGKFVDPRITASLRDIDSAGKKVCDPNRTTTYDNTIGNNLCYIDQCLEQSLDTHRLIPGRAPLTVGDSAYPYDSCEPQATVKDQVQFFGVPLSIPPYRPEMLIKNIDTALCQSNGLPTLSPPILCSFDARRRLLLPMGDLFGMSLNILDQSNAQEAAALGVQSLSDALGARIASELFAGYLQGSARGLGDITHNAASLLQNFTRVKFSPEMCPATGNGNSNWLLTNPVCNPSSNSSSSR